MIELENKYKFGERRFGVNWIGAYALYLKETLRFIYTDFASSQGY